MKKIFTGLLFLIIGLTSCNDWFDVSPKSDVKADELFENEDGFRDVLTGVYSLMATENLYGRQLTFGYTDVLAQYYDGIRQGTHEYIKTIDFKYEEPVDKAVIQSIWSTQYKAIVNLNSLLEYAEKNKNVFNTETIYCIYKGEALALRAFLHFDMLRLFAPSTAMGKDLEAIPYMEEYTNVTPPRSTVGEVLQKVIRDLEAARELMKDFDSYGPKYDEFFEEYKDNKQLRNRHVHMNYYAITALLARVYLYADQPQEALATAKEIIGEPTDDLVEPFELVKRADDKNVLFEKEILFGLDMPQLDDIVKQYSGQTAIDLGSTTSTKILPFSTRLLNNLFVNVNPADDDYRRKLWFNDLGNEHLSNKFEDQKILPLLRVSELYYIAAECAGAETGLAYLNKIRGHRGLAPLPGGVNLQNEIYKEYCKEFLSEGQMFYYFKRKNLSRMGVFRGRSVNQENVYILPLPTDEEDYGNKKMEELL